MLLIISMQACSSMVSGFTDLQQSGTRCDSSCMAACTPALHAGGKSGGWAIPRQSSFCPSCNARPCDRTLGRFASNRILVLSSNCRPCRQSPQDRKLQPQTGWYSQWCARTQLLYLSIKTHTTFAPHRSQNLSRQLHVLDTGYAGILCKMVMNMQYLCMLYCMLASACRAREHHHVPHCISGQCRNSRRPAYADDDDDMPEPPPPLPAVTGRRLQGAEDADLISAGGRALAGLLNGASPCALHVDTSCQSRTTSHVQAFTASQWPGQKQKPFVWRTCCFPAWRPPLHQRETVLSYIYTNTRTTDRQTSRVLLTVNVLSPPLR